MGHSRYAYGHFNDDLVRPLYGYVTDLSSGEVPRWTEKPALREADVKDLLGIPWDKHQNGIPERTLPDGFSVDSGGRGPTRYPVRRDVYLEQSREMIREQDGDKHGGTVEYDLDFGSGYTRRGASTVPDDIRERLDAVRKTTRWDRQIDGYHEQFRRWVLAYQVGPRGGIQDVQILADTHH